MNKELSIMIMLLYLSGMWVFSSKRKHLLIVLLSLEYMVLMTYLMMVMMLSSMNYNMFMLMLYLVFAVCEGALSLGVLVSMIRSYGNDYFKFYCLLK